MLVGLIFLAVATGAFFLIHRLERKHYGIIPKRALVLPSAIFGLVGAAIAVAVFVHFPVTERTLTATNDLVSYEISGDQYVFSYEDKDAATDLIYTESASVEYVVIQVDGKDSVTKRVVEQNNFWISPFITTTTDYVLHISPDNKK